MITERHNKELLSEKTLFMPFRNATYAISLKIK